MGFNELLLLFNGSGSWVAERHIASFAPESSLNALLEILAYFDSNP